MKPFLEGKRSSSTDALRSQAATQSAPCHVDPRGLALKVPGSPGAQVEVVKEGDKVVRLVVHCTCGERVEVECLYPAGH